MATIRILPEILANKIAAGEVVERPASVVKELVENALDAGSTRILIDIDNGGRALIQVADNGQGMSTDDALMALERFATSKIASDADLFAIETLGFRGEALPSIAAVSKMTLTTRTLAAENGVTIDIQGGKIRNVNETGAPPGTMIRVAQLFFNTPARRKFLKSTTTEISHIADTVAGMALAHHQVYFKLSHNGKSVKQWLRVSRPAERVADVLGQGGSEKLIALDYRNGSVHLTGCLGPARLTRSTSRGIYLFVNGRRVRDRVIQHALFEGYRGRLMRGQFPMAVLFLDIPFDQVDVNVHPTKHEVRFSDSRQVYTSVRDGVADALRQGDGHLRHTRSTEDRWTAAEVTQAPPAYGPSDKPAGGVQSNALYRSANRPDRPAADDAAPVAATAMDTSRPAPEPAEPSPPAGAARPEQKYMWAKGRFADLSVIGQFRGTYIICQDGDDLILIDQHAAHERIVYEQLVQGRGVNEVQRLLIPETVELDFGEAEALLGLIPQLNAMGMEIEHFGGGAFVVKALPALLDDRNAGQLVSNLAERAAETGLDTDLNSLLDDCRMLMACHHAVRANQRLAPQQIAGMLHQLDACENPSHCPHGRPTWIRWTLRELEKAFKRTGP